MATKILFNGNRIIFDGHADTAEECRAITAVCDSIANNENFKTIVYEEGHAVFEQVSGGESEMFAMQDYVLTSRYNDETGYSAALLAAKSTIAHRLSDLELVERTLIGSSDGWDDLNNNGKGSIIERLRNLEAQIATLTASQYKLPYTASELVEKLSAL